MPSTPGRAQRPAAIAFAVLLLATAAAFLVANRLKSAESAIEVVKRDKFFSPNGDGRRDLEKITFRIDETDTAAIDVVDADGVRVRRISEDVRVRRNRRRKVTWDGRDDAGRVAPDGEYRLRVILDQGRSLTAPRFFLLDTVAPEPTLEVDPETPIVAPGEPVDFTYEGEEDAVMAPEFKVMRTDVSPPREVRTIPGVAGQADYTWDGETGIGVEAPSGTYVIQVTAYDRAENAATVPALPLAPGSEIGRAGVTVRRLAVQPPVRAIRAGAPVNVRVDARGRSFDWSLRRLGAPEAADRGSRDPGRTNILFDAPTGSSGVYMLTVEAAGERTRVPIAVRSGARTGFLVVLPMLTWLGQDPVDQTLDGVPDVFGSGFEVRYPRPFVFPSGVPPFFGNGVAPLLEYLDREEIEYDLVTDLDLTFAEDVLAGQDGVLMLPAAQWTSRPVADRLRDYVEGGGRLGLFGPSALTGSVTVGDEVLSRASPLTRSDALGGTLSEVTDSSGPLTVLQEAGDLGLFEGFSGSLSGFTRVEELEDPGPGELRAGVGAETTELRPALSAVTVGEGLVIRIGLPEWGARLGRGWAVVEQLTANIADVLRGAEPRVRTARG